MNFFCVFAAESGDFMSRCEPLFSMLFVKLNLPAVGWRDIVFIPCNLRTPYEHFQVQIAKKNKNVEPQLQN